MAPERRGQPERRKELILKRKALVRRRVTLDVTWPDLWSKVKMTFTGPRIVYNEDIADEFFDEVVTKLKLSQIEVELQPQPSGPVNAIEWILPTAVIVYLGKPFVDAFLKRAADDFTNAAYPKIKDAITTLATKVMIGTRGVWQRIKSSGPVPREGRSTFFSIESVTKRTTRLKFVFDENRTEAEYELQVEQAIHVIALHHGEADAASPSTHSETWGTIFMVFDHDASIWRAVDVMEEVRNQRHKADPV